MQVYGVSGWRHCSAGIVFSLIFAFMSISASDSLAQAPSPDGGITVSNRRPGFVWTSAPSSTWYRVWLNRDGKQHYTKWLEQTGTTWTVDIDLRGGSYTWWVQGWSPEDRSGSWSAPYTFFVPTAVPPQTVLQGPTGELTNGAPVFTWSAASNTTWYYLWIAKDGKRYSLQWIEGDTNYTPRVDLPPGSYQWWVRTWGPDGYGPWSDAAEFSYGVSTPLAPQGATTNSTTQFAWTAVPGATWYYVWINRGKDIYRKQWVEGATNLTLASALPTGDYRWWVMPWSIDLTGAWSKRAELLLPVPGTYEHRVVSYRMTYGKSEAWQTWMFANKSRYRYVFAASAAKPATIKISFRYETTPIAYNPPWTDEAEHMAELKKMAEGAYPGYTFKFLFNGSTGSSYANVTAGTAGTTSYAWGRNVYLYYETIFNHEFGHVMNVRHHYDTPAQTGDGLHMPPGDTECLMDRNSYLFCSACRTALGIPLDITDDTAVDTALTNILAHYP